MNTSEHPLHFANQVVDRCASTNDLARAMGEAGVPHGTWVSARMQEAGRGRMGRSWQSLEGNLFLSLVCRIADKSLWTWVPLVSAVGVCKALSQLDPALELAIKWPNDLWFRGAKLGGILCEAVGDRRGSFIIIGLGLNCASSPLVDQATISLGRNVDEVRPLVIREILAALAALGTSGAQFLVEEYERRAVFRKGTELEWTENAGTHGVVKHGVSSGLGPGGELLVETDQGRLKLYAEDVRVKSVLNSR